MAETLIEFRDVMVSRQDEPVLEHVDLSLEAGQMVYLIGKVGSGKSSLLKTMYKELDLKGQEARVLDFDLRTMRTKDVPKLRRKLGIIFQDFQLLTDRDVHDNLEFVLRATGWKSSEEIRKRISIVLRLVGMESKAHKRPNELSGGEQQRIVIARSVLNSPSVILADEPTGNLDVETSRQIARILYDISKVGCLVVMSTHNLQLLEEFPGSVYRFQDKRVIKEETKLLK